MTTPEERRQLENRRRFLIRRIKEARRELEAIDERLKEGARESVESR